MDAKIVHDDEPPLWAQILMGALVIAVYFGFLCIGDYIWG